MLGSAHIQVGPIDYSIMAIYVLFVLGIGWVLKRSMKTSSDFLTSGKSIPAWITGLAFISTNLGALEVIGMGASGAKYGLPPVISTGSARSPQWCFSACS